MSEGSIRNGGVMVTGGGGFLGGTAIEHLLSAGEKVIGTDRNIDNEPAERLKLSRLDNTNEEETRKFVWDNLPNTILHFAGIAKQGEVAGDEELGRKVNIEAVMFLLGAIVYARKKEANYNPTIIVAGSVEQIGDPSDNNQVSTEDHPFTEESPRNPVTAYGRQKEIMALGFIKKCRENNIRGYVVIQGQVTGVSPSGEISQKTGFLIPDIASQIAAIEKSGQEQGVLKTGVVENKRPILDVNDAIEAYLKLALTTPTPGEYIVCAPKSRPIKDSVDILIQNSNVRLIHEIDKSRGFGGPDRFYSPKKITDSTGWKPEIPLEQTLKDLLNWYRAKV